MPAERMLDVADRHTVEDILWRDDAYRDVNRRAGLEVVELRRPLGYASEPYPWVSETLVARWTMYVLQPATSRSKRPER